MKKKIISIITMCAATAILSAGCGSGSNASNTKVTYKDGVYEGQSSVFTDGEENGEGNGYGVVSLTIKDGAIAECTYQTYTVEGELKDTEYGKQNGEIANRDYYNKAQKAVAACEKYAAALLEAGSLDKVDGISGATVNYNEFVEAVQAALALAAE